MEINITDQLKESIEYQEAPEEEKEAYAEYLDKWFEKNKYVDVENNPLTFKQWRFQGELFDILVEG